MSRALETILADKFNQDAMDRRHHTAIATVLRNKARYRECEVDGGGSLKKTKKLFRQRIAVCKATITNKRSR